MRLEAIAQPVICSLAGCSMLLAAPVVEASETPALAFHPVEIEGSDAAVGKDALKLVGPDTPEAPTLWEGPIRVQSKGHLRCTLDAELIAGLYADSAGRALLVVSQSGANTYLILFSLEDCRLAATSEALFTEGIDAAGTRIEVRPGCECTGSPEICACSAAKVLRVAADLAMREDVSASRALTRAQLGVTFEGEARVAHPGTPGARIVDD